MIIVLFLAMLVAVAIGVDTSPVAIIPLTLPTLNTQDPVFHTWVAASVIMALQVITLLVIIFRTHSKRMEVSRKY